MELGRLKDPVCGLKVDCGRLKVPPGVISGFCDGTGGRLTDHGGMCGLLVDC